MELAECDRNGCRNDFDTLQISNSGTHICQTCRIEFIDLMDAKYPEGKADEITLKRELEEFMTTQRGKHKGVMTAIDYFDKFR